MTRAQMRDRLQNLLGELQGTPGGDNPFALDSLLTESADELARATYCWHTQVDSEIISSLTTFCAPQIFYITNVTATDENGALRSLVERAPESLDRGFSGWGWDPLNLGAGVGWGAAWRDPNQWATGTPLFYLSSGLNEVRVYPVPNYTSTVAMLADLATTATPTVVSSATRNFVAGDVNTYLDVTGGAGWTLGRYLIVSVAASNATLDSAPAAASTTGGAATLTQGGLSVYGYACPGDSWPDDADSCPLPDREHIAVVYGAAINRVIQFPSNDNAARLPQLQSVYRDMRGKLEGEAATLSRGQRDRRRYGGWY